MLTVEALLTFIQQEIIGSDEPKVAPNSRLFDDGLIDSLNILNLIGYIEKSIGRRLTDQELLFANFATPEEIVKNYAKAQ